MHISCASVLLTCDCAALGGDAIVDVCDSERLADADAAAGYIDADTDVQLLMTALLLAFELRSGRRLALRALKLRGSCSAE